MAKQKKDSNSTDAYFWYGDKNHNALICLEKFAPRERFMGRPATDGSTRLIIITAAMRKTQDAVEARELRSRQENKAKALKEL